MVTDRIAAVEFDRASELRGRFALDRPSIEIFAGLVRMIARVFGVAHASISFEHDGRTWFETSSSTTVAESGVLAATVALLSHGNVVGSISVRDRNLRKFDREQKILLHEFGTLVVANYESRWAALREREIERYRLGVLQLAANDAPLQTILDSLVDCVEYCVEDSICTISTLRSGSLFGAAAGGAMPGSYLAAIEGLRIGSSHGSCGTAAELRRTVIVRDIATDPLWLKYRHVAAAAGLASCWSTPICNSENVVLGTLAIYRRYPCEPSEAHLEFTHEAAHVASIAIEANSARLKLEHMALHDPLTNLPNRALFEDRMQQAIASARRSGRSVAIGLMDLDRFKLVNDSLGHAAGDRLLMDVANRLRGAVRPQDTVARMGGDEFLLLMVDLEDAQSARPIAERFVATLDPNFTPSGCELLVSGSMGVSVYPDDSHEAPNLLRQADGAMYLAKASGEKVRFYARPASEALSLEERER